MPGVYALTRIYVSRNINGVPTDTFAVLAEPTRRQILDRLCTSESSVGDLVDALDVSQPTMSKHLKVLRDSGFVSCRVDAQRRIYRVEAPPFERLDEWLEPYRRLWARHLDALERHLDSQDHAHDDSQEQR